MAGARVASGRGRGRWMLVATFVWTVLVSRQGLELVASMRAALFQILLACLLVWALIAPVRG